MSEKTLVFITGPTGVGKTKFSITLAKKLKTEILSCDSRQFYKELTIGVATPSPEELSQVKHHFVKQISILTEYSIGEYQRKASRLIDELFKDHDYLILVGGPGLYAETVLYGLDKIPCISNNVREELEKNYKIHGINYLQKLLEEVDPDYFDTVDQQNPRRLLRALEVYHETGKPFSNYLNQKQKIQRYKTIIVKLGMSRDELYRRINNRVDDMLKQGLLDEVKSLISYRDRTPLNTIGYKELYNFLDGKYTLGFAIEEIKKNTRRFAKRQITFSNRFRNSLDIESPFSVDRIISYLK